MKNNVYRVVAINTHNGCAMVLPNTFPNYDTAHKFVCEQNDKNTKKPITFNVVRHDIVCKTADINRMLKRG